MKNVCSLSRSEQTREVHEGLIQAYSPWREDSLLADWRPLSWPLPANIPDCSSYRDSPGRGLGLGLDSPGRRLGLDSPGRRLGLDSPGRGLGLDSPGRGLMYSIRRGGPRSVRSPYCLD